MKQNFKTKEEARQFFNDLHAKNEHILDAREQKDGSFDVQWIEKKQYVARDGVSYDDEVWITEPGDLVHVQDLTEAHAKNIIRMMIRNERTTREQLAKLLAMIGDEGEMDEVAGVASEEAPHTLH